MRRMTLGEIASACGGRLSDAADAAQTVCDIKIDSRKVQSGDLFIAIKGERFDGNDFLDDAYQNGAVCAVCERPAGDKPYILVESTFAALKDIAAYYRSMMDVKVVAVTGSVGKTTAKEMLYAVLSQKYDVLKTQGNFNNEYGLPQTMFRIEEHHDVAVIEMGMSGFGEISELSRIAKPDAAVIMNIGESHIGNLGSRDGIFQAKCEIFDYMNEDAPAVLNGDDDKLVTMKRRSTVFFGKGKHNDVSLREITHTDMRGTRLIADCFGETLELFIPKPGAYLVYPALAAAAIGKKLGLTNAQITDGVAQFVPVGMRMDVRETDKLTIINDVYNASRQSMRAGAQTLAFAKGRKVAIIGDILELGEYGRNIHTKTGEEMGALGIDLIICVGELAQYMAEGARRTSSGDVQYFPAQEALLGELNKWIRTGDTVFVKASRGMHFENISQRLETL